MVRGGTGSLQTHVPGQEGELVGGDGVLARRGRDLDSSVGGVEWAWDSDEGVYGVIKPPSGTTLSNRFNFLVGTILFGACEISAMQFPVVAGLLL